MSKNFWRNVFHGSDLSKETGPYVQRIRVNTYPVRLKFPKIPGEWPANHRFARFLWTYWRRASPDFFGHFAAYPVFWDILAPHFPCFIANCNSLPGFIGHIPAARACSKGANGSRTSWGMRKMTTHFWHAKIGRGRI